MAFSEHGSIFQWVKKKTYIEEKGMKYIHAEEFYVTETLNERVRDNKHCVLIAKNIEGVHELNRLSSVSFRDDHKYYTPRITLDELMGTSDNIIVTTACLGGVLANVGNNFREKMLDFIIKNKHRCFLEIQHHIDDSQISYNTYLYELSRKYDIPLIAGTDTHALNTKHLRGRTILQIAKNIHFSNEESWDLIFKTYDELVAAYKKQNSLPLNVVLQAIENTNRMADMVEAFELDYTYKYPHLWENPEKVFMDKIQEGIKRRGVDKYPNYQEYVDRINSELIAYKHNGAIDFMLLMEDIISWCIKHEIYVGYGRGSCNGSVIAWLLGITEMDSIKHKLNFERFMNVERVSLSDIDTDFPPSRRKDVKDYIFSKTGLYCCDIITFNTIAMKGAIRDVSRALHISLDEVGNICEKVEFDEEFLRKKYGELFEYVDIVIGTIVSVGSHPCGTVVSPHEVEDAFGTFRSTTSEYPISQIYMKEIDFLNYVKLDLLALDTIELINETCKLAGIERLTPDNVDINDVKVWNSMRDDTTQIFQWEGNTGNAYIKKLLSDENIAKLQKANNDIDRMTLLSIGNSAIRPAGASYRDDLANGVIRSIGAKPIDDFLKSTFGYLVFQCQIIEFLHEYCGFTMGEADIVRRGFAKKTGTDQYIPIIKDGGHMPKSDHYINGYVSTMEEKYGIPRDKSEKDILAFIQVIDDASSYLFSLNHSQPYSYEGYVSGWLRYYYPVEFITNALNINRDKEEKTIGITEYARNIGVPIKPIKFRYSGAKYTCDKKEKCVYKGIASVKYLNDDAANDLYSIKDEKFETFIDLLVRITDLKVDSRKLEILIKLDFFEEFGNIQYLLTCNELFSKYYGKKQMKKDKALENGVDFELVRKYSGKETQKTFMGFDSLAFLKELAKSVLNDKTPIKMKIAYQIENLGYVDIVDKKYKGYCVALDLNVDYSPRLKLYALANGNTIPVKVSKKIYKQNPIRRGDLVKVTNQYRKPKMKKVDGEWIETDEMEWWISEYAIY